MSERSRVYPGSGYSQRRPGDRRCPNDHTLNRHEKIVRPSNHRDSGLQDRLKACPQERAGAKEKEVLVKVIHKIMVEGGIGPKGIITRLIRTTDRIHVLCRVRLNISLGVYPTQDRQFICPAKGDKGKGMSQAQQKAPLCWTCQAFKKESAHVQADCPHRQEQICRICVGLNREYHHDYKQCEKWLDTPGAKKHYSQRVKEGSQGWLNL